MKYINRYSNLNAAQSSLNNFSPNMTWIGGIANPNGVVTTDVGVNKEIEFVDNGGGYVIGEEKTPNYLCFTAELAGSTVSLNKNGSPYDASFQYSRDKKNWSTYSFGSTITLSNIGDKVYFRGDNSSGLSKDPWSNYYNFNLSGKVAASGNIMSLIDSSCERMDIPCNYCFADLFYDCTSLTQAPELPATTLTNSCYSYMFRGCTSLTQAPELPATTLSLSCYSNMFNRCTSLTQAPELTATTLQSSCYYYMFYGCTSLTQAPELPATTLAEYCYNNMFNGCTSLTQATELRGINLVQCCYLYMFSGCTNLNFVKVSFTNWNSSLSPTANWLSNVSSSGTFKCPSALPKTRGVSNIPSGWSIVNS